MPTVFSHAVAALGLGAAFFGRKAPAGVLALGALCAALPAAVVAGVGLRSSVFRERPGARSES